MWERIGLQSARRDPRDPPPTFVGWCFLPQTVAKKRVIEHKINALDAHRKMAAKEESVGAIRKVGTTVVSRGLNLMALARNYARLGLLLSLSERSGCEGTGLSLADVILLGEDNLHKESDAFSGLVILDSPNLHRSHMRSRVLVILSASFLFLFFF